MTTSSLLQSDPTIGVRQMSLADMNEQTRQPGMVRMNVFGRYALLGVVASWVGLTAQNGIASDLPVTNSNILCTESPKGAVLPIPALVSDWVAIICLDSGQALVPEVKKYRQIWTTADGKPFILTASPAGWKKPDSISRYEIRFSALTAVERSGVELAKTLKMWDLGFGGGSRPAIDRVVQLDAQSVVNGALYNIFFYTMGDRPRWVIICKNACQSSIALTVRDITPK